jgi:hypothetical protein
VLHPTTGKKSRLESMRYGQALDRDRAIFCNVKENQVGDEVTRSCERACRKCKFSCFRIRHVQMTKKEEKKRTMRVREAAEAWWATRLVGGEEMDNIKEETAPQQARQATRLVGGKEKGATRGGWWVVGSI